jgi:aminoglycoside phosphotransferase family enzyme/predicted kinase
MATSASGDLAARVVESHISVLIFLGDRVYKLRKPVRFDFLDFTSREARQADCAREVELNARFAPGVYLGVIDISSEGVPIDHLVVMRRLPAERRLAALVASGDAREAIRAVARVLVDIDQYSLRSPEIESAATRDAVREAWTTNFAEMEPFIGELIDPEAEERLRRLVGQFLEGREPVFAARLAAGRIRDGHGDLQAEDIFVLDDGPRILDCIEFEDHLRYGDVLSDLAFLAMDLARLGHAELGDALFSDYEELSADALPRGLANHYCAARAYVRAKVACLADTEGTPGAAETARALHRLALSFLERARVRIVLVGGAPGSGKSTLAAALGDELGMVVLRSDEVRRELVGVTDETSGSSDVGGSYSDAMTRATYATLLERARLALGFGQSVILDASWTSEALRQAARELGAATASDLVELRCEVPEATAVRRIAARRRLGGDPSEATATVARQMAAAADPWPEASTVDTSGPRRSGLSRALHLLRS